jgi:hypothetical protein
MQEDMEIKRIISANTALLERRRRQGNRVVLLRIQGLGFKDPTLWPFFAGEARLLILSL